MTNQPSSVLIMDDDEAVCELLTEILSIDDHQVQISHNGEQALERYQQALDAKTPFNAVIMDLTIPGSGGGKAVVKQILSIDANAKVIVSSGNSTDPAMTHPIEHGFKAAVAKPYSMKQLLSVVADVIAG